MTNLTSHPPNQPSPATAVEHRCPDCGNTFEGCTCGHHPGRTTRDELRDCFLSDSRDRFEAAADAYRTVAQVERDDQIITWLSKKAIEYRSAGGRRHRTQADAIETMASEIACGAVLATTAEPGKDTHPGESTQLAPLSGQHLAEIQERVLNATPGPWKPCAEYGENFYAHMHGEMLLPVGTLDFGDSDTADADRLLVEHAAQDLAALLVRVANLETTARSAAVMLRSAAALADGGQPSRPGALRQAATCLDEAAGGERA